LEDKELTSKNLINAQCHLWSEDLVTNQNTTILEVSGLCAWYSFAQILFDINLKVSQGEVVALMGRNGAGKSTTLKALMGLMHTTRGSISFMHSQLQALKPYQRSQLGMGFVPEDRRIFSDLSVMENLKVASQKAHYFSDETPGPTWSEERVFDLFPSLKPLIHRMGSELSGGEQQMLSIARTLMGNPLVLLLDEPSEGVSPLILEQLGEMIVKLKSEGLSILLSEQNASFVSQIADRAYVIEKGQIVHESDLSSLMLDESVLNQHSSI
jgi:branched-chain amino acid transport system ATP-binding protein